MWKKLLEFAGFPRLVSQAQDIMQTVEKQPPTQALASLMSWLPTAMERCHSPLQQLELLNTVSTGATQIIDRVHRELMDSEGNPVKTHLLLQHSAPLAAWIRDQYATHLHHALPSMQKSGPTALWALAMSHYLDWSCSAFVLAFFVPPAPPGIDWHTIYGVYEPTRQMLDRHAPSRLLGRADAQRLLVQASLSRLLLMVRSLGTDLGGRQILIAARVVETLHPFVTMDDRHGQNTPYGTNIHEMNPPTLLDGSKPPQSGHKLFFGLDAALTELMAIENMVLTQGLLADRIVVAPSQTTAETLTVLKHLRNRWSGRPLVRKANRSLIQTPVDLIVSMDRIHTHLSGRNPQSATQKQAHRLNAIIEDRSATGFGLIIEGPAPWAAVGSLVAIFPPEMPRGGIGTIRRVSMRTKNKIMLGLQLLSMEPQALRLQETATAAQWQLVAGHESLDSHAAIYLPASPLNSGQASLLTGDRVLRSGETYRARYGGQDLWLHVQAIQELGTEHVQYSCLRTEGPPGSTSAPDTHK